MSRPERQRIFHFLFDGGLLVGTHHVVAGINLLGVFCHAQIRILFLVAQNPGLTLGHDVVTELALGDAVAPILESAFGELHDVTLVHQTHDFAFVGQCPLDGRTHQPLGAFR